MPAQGGDEAAAQPFLDAYHGAAGRSPGHYPVVPEDKAAAVLHACQIPAEKISAEVGSQLFTQTVTRAAAVAVKTVTWAGHAHFLRPVLAGARTVTTLAWRVTSVGPAARYPLFAGLALIVLGALASTSTVNVLSAAGLAADPGRAAAGRGGRGPPHRAWRWRIVTVAAGAALAAAALHPGAARPPVPVAGEDRPAQPRQAPRRSGPSW